MKHFKVLKQVFDFNLAPIEFCAVFLSAGTTSQANAFRTTVRLQASVVARSSVAKAVKSLQEKQNLKVQHNYYNHTHRM